MKAGSIEVRNVGKVYPTVNGGSFVALEKINLTISESEFVCLVGPSGCGKSTVLNMVAGFEEPTTGEILHAGSRVTHPEPRRAMIFQDVQGSLFSWLTVRQNTEFGLRMRGIPQPQRRETSDHYLKLVGLSNFADVFPHQLSGGMKQRVQIARALAMEPLVLLMDEPFGALDAQTRSNLQGELERIWWDTHKTVVFVTHDIGEAVRLADRVIVFSSGPKAHLLSEIDVSLPRPRSAISSDFVDYYRHIEALLHPSTTISA